jgi:membrane protein YdbS with pleckstrin-like domain
MGSDHKSESPMRNPFLWVFHASLLLLGAVIALNLSVAFLQPILPWIVGCISLAALAWIVVGIVRWRRSRW